MFKNIVMELDEILTKHGGLSYYQMALLAFCSATAMLMAIVPQTPVMFSTIPDHRCFTILDNNTTENYTQNINLSSLIPRNAQGEYDSCKMFSNLTDNNTNNSSYNNSTYGLSNCVNGWFYDKTYFTENTISEWNLVCDRQILESISTSIFLGGGLVGSLFVGTLSDWFGRKYAFLGTLAAFLATSISVSFIQNFWLFVFMRFLVSVFGLAAALTNITYFLEIVDTKSKSLASALATFSLGFGRVLVPGIAYFVRHWRYLNLVYTLAVAPIFIFSFLIPESPRWLIANGKLIHAEVLLKRFAKSNNCEWDLILWKKFLDYNNKQVGLQNMDKRYTLKDLFGTARISSLSLATLFCWFSTSLVFFGLSLNGGNLSGDPYLNTTLNGLAEVVAAFLFMVTNKMSLRPRGSVGLITAGICCLLSIMSTSENQVVVSVGVAMAIIGKLFATFGYTTIGFLTLGTYPTKIRSMAYSTGAAGARLGAMISPFALYLQFSTPWLPSVVFGVLTIIGGFVILLYPETLNIPLITTLQEAEPFYAEEMKFYNKLKGVLLKRKSKRKQSTIPIVGKVNPTFQGDIAENTKPCRIPNSEDIVETEF